MTWKCVKDFYINILKVPPTIVDILSVYEILNDCCSGFSNKSISDFYDIPEDYIRKLLKRYLKFTGWEKDLDINPLMIYNKVVGDEESFYAFAMPAGVLTKDELLTSYKACKIFDRMERKLNKFYG